MRVWGAHETGTRRKWNRWRNQGLLQRLFGVWPHLVLLRRAKAVACL